MKMQVNSVKKILLSEYHWCNCVDCFQEIYVASCTTLHFFFAIMCNTIIVRYYCRVFFDENLNNNLSLWYLLTKLYTFILQQ